MKKNQYIQPKCETMVIPADALMGDDLILSGSGTLNEPKTAPKRKWLF